MSTFTTRNDLQQESNGRPSCIRFKKVYTTNVKFYMINPNWTTRQLYEFIKPYVFIDFEISDFEIVQAGQPGAEQATPIRITNNTTMNEMFDNLDDLTFYIREYNGW